MGDSAWNMIMLLLLSAATAVPTSNTREALRIHDVTKDLSAESSEIIQEVVAPPSKEKISQDADTAATNVHRDQSIELVGGSQTFFPSFANLFEPRQQSSYRLGFTNTEGAYSQRPNSYRSLLNYPLFSNYRNLENFDKPNTAAPAPLVDASSSVLGSGNFGIIRGGTFFAQNDEESDFGDGFNSYYNNGHGRPSVGVGYIANPRPNHNQEQFANFRDFADINQSPPNADYSHFVVVYANKNATVDEVSQETRKVLSKPKNIIETLENLEKTKSSSKLSKSKAKLESTKQKSLTKKEQWKKTNNKHLSQKHDPEEPLLALS